MTRVLTFTGDKAEMRFQMLRTAILTGGDGKGERTRAILRKEARLLDALDAISDPPASDVPDHEARVLNTTGGRGTTITLTQEDFDLLSTYVDKTPWTPRASRDAVDVQDWLSAAEKVEP